MKHTALMAMLLVLLPGTVLGQETDIAEDEKWYLLGETLFAYEQGAMVAVGEAASRCIAEESARWAAALESGVPDDTAREMAYLHRIAALQYLQPAAARASGMALPSVPELIAVLAPEDDEAGTPKDYETRAEDLITGPLRYELDNPEHMGLAVETGLGLQVFVFLMELGNQPAHDVLLALAQAGSDEQYLVAGNRLEAADGIPNLRTDQCRWVYRLAQ